MRPTWLAVIVSFGIGIITGAVITASVLQATFTQLLNN